VCVFIFVLLGKNIGRQTATRILGQKAQYKMICNSHELNGRPEVLNEESEIEIIVVERI